MKVFIKAFTLAAILLTASILASAQKVTYNFMPGTNFSQYKTYAWQKVPNAQYPNQLLDEQIIRSIDSQLRAKGLVRMDTGATDLVVVYQAAVTQDKEWNSYSTGGGGWGWGGWGGWGGMDSTHTYSTTIHTGTLNVDLYDVSTKKQIWRGEVTKTVKAQKDPAKLQKNLDKAVAKLFTKYPPPAKS